MTRTRNKPEQARRTILEAAHRYFMEGGPEAVKIQRIARDLGMTDAAIHYHFRNRRNLLAALLKFAGASLKRRLSDNSSTAVPDVARELESAYARQGYARLAMWLSLEGWTDEGTGMFAELVDRWRERHPDKSLEEAKYEIAFVNLVLAAEPLMGASFLRSVDLPDDAGQQSRFHHWIVGRLEELVDGAGPD